MFPSHDQNAEGITSGKEVIQEATQEVAKVTSQVSESFMRITEQIIVSFAEMAVEGKKSIGQIIHEIGKMIKSLVIAYVLQTLIKGILTGGLSAIDMSKLLGTGALMFGIGTVLSKASPGTKGDIPEMAKGGIVTGPTLAMIGEAGSEAVIPLDRLNNMINPQSAKGEFTLRGQDLILALERAGDFRTRVTG